MKGKYRLEDIDAYYYDIPMIGRRYFIRRRVRILGIPIPFFRQVMNGGIPMFFSSEQVDRKIEELTNG